MSDVERELKLTPRDPALLDRLASQTQFGELALAGRRRELQHNRFFDTSSRRLSSVRVGFRRRTVEGESLATWSLKANAAVWRGVATRTEIELQLDPDLAPALAFGALRQAANQRGVAALAKQIDDALCGGGLLSATPFLELRTDRTLLDLAAQAAGWKVELALDRVSLVGHAYSEVEIEAELKCGDEAALKSVRQAIEAHGVVRESAGSKLSRAIAHLRRCRCARS